ncbi:MAG: phage tail protein [Zoogloeaceae bacterium]|jgi:hypothetical protein|nr:phage tail protein [Zoogloeaceae bacterium]
MPRDMLPPNRTPLETAIADTAPRLALDGLADAPRLLKFYPPQSILPWLASEWFLAGFVKYHETLQDLIEEGLPWLMERGTAAAVKRALSWIGMDAVLLEEDGARLQLDTGRVLLAEELPDLVYLAAASLPAHVDLYRLYHAYDLRPIGLSRIAALDDGLLSDDSGVWVDVNGEPVKLSFGHRISRRINASDHGAWLMRRDIAFDRAWYEDRARLSVWALDSVIVRNLQIRSTSAMILTNAPLKNPVSLGRHLNIARAALELSGDTEPFGDLNCGFAGGCEIEYNPFVLSASRLSDHDNDLRHIFIDERFSRKHAAHPAPLPIQTAYPATRTARRVARFARSNVCATWRGGWDTRRWYPRSIRLYAIRVTETTED